MDSRLELIASMVGPGSTVADIGTDHGHLIVELVKRGIARNGYACDINEMPLEKAKREIECAGLQDKITPVLCDGLEGLKNCSPDHIVIAGMGGELISSILDRSPLKGRGGIHYILQPMTKPERLREYLYTNGYEIIREDCATEGKFTYSVILARFTGKPHTPTLREKFLGEITDFNNPYRKLYGRRVLGRLHNKVSGMKQAGQEVPDLSLLAQEIERELENN